MEGSLPEVKEWSGTLPDLSGVRPTWVIIPTEAGAVYVAVDTSARTVAAAVHVAEQSIPRIDEQIQKESSIVDPRGRYIIGGVRAPCCRPNPPGIPDDILKLSYEYVMSIESLKVRDIENGILRAQQH